MSNELQKEIFTVEMDKNGKKETVELAVIAPKSKQNMEAQLCYNKAFSEAVDSKAKFRKAMDAKMLEQGIWNVEKEKEYYELAEQIGDDELALSKGGLRLNEAKELAINIRRNRYKLRNLISERADLDSNTVEGQAENARFNALVAACLVYNNNGERVYRDVDDFMENAKDEVIFQASTLMASITHGLNKESEASLPENRFLKKYKFVNEDLSLVDSEGRLVDTKGKLINEDGRYVDKDGNFVDVDGNPVEDESKYDVDTAVFLDDETGKPIEEKEEEDETPTITKKRGRPRKTET